MKAFIIFVLLIVAISAERYIPNSPDPDKSDHCYHNDLKISIKNGEVVRPTNIGECIELGCQDQAVIRINECGRYPPHCTIVSNDYSQEYPKCCPKLKCS